MLSTAHRGIALAALILTGPIQGQALPPAPVQYIDHIMIRCDEPAELFAFFSQTLQLPIAWPLADRGGVVSGGVGFGNVNIEAIRFPGQIGGPTPTHLVGLALKPASLSESLIELERRGIAYGAPRPFLSVGTGGVTVTSFTNVTLREFSDADRPADATIQVFLSEYNPAYVDAVERRARLRDELAARRGGPIGVVRVQEVVVGTTDLGGASRRWQTLVAPAPPSDADVWSIGDGPAVRLVQADTNMIQGLVLAVIDLPTARDFLAGKSLLGASSRSEVVIAPSKIGGVRIRLVGEPQG